MGCCYCGGYFGYNGKSAVADSWSCCGYAKSVFSYVYGKAPSRTYDKVIREGDLINYGKTPTNQYGHWIFVTKVSGDTIYYTDANGINNAANRIQWGSTINKHNLGSYSIMR